MKVENLNPSERYSQYDFKFQSVSKRAYWLEDHFRHVQSNGESDLAQNAEVH